ncbi:MAG TPA: hypothetical protein VLI39_17075 [Sedimentisphaerales bacterium]|nr:hypothetical protein [Sedimentisphaerales bacterium]
MDLQNPKWMYLKAGLSAFIVFSCFVLVWVEAPTVRTALLLSLMIWASARAYYFAFYVVEKYIDPQYRFSGLISFFQYLLSPKSRARDRQQAPSQEPEAAYASQFRLARIVVATFGAGVTSLGVLFALDGEIWLGAVLCVCGSVCILTGMFASRSVRKTPSRDG